MRFYVLPTDVHEVASHDAGEQAMHAASARPGWLTVRSKHGEIKMPDGGVAVLECVHVILPPEKDDDGAVMKPRTRLANAICDLMNRDFADEAESR